MNMKRLRIERMPAPGWVQALIPVAAVAVTFLLVAVLVALAGARPTEAYYYFLVSPFTTRSGAIEVLVKSTPYLLTGAAVTFAFAGGYWNIGAEGQLYAGAGAAAWLGVLVAGWHPLLALPLVLLGSAAAGALWALPPAWLKARLGVDEVVTTLLLNPVMLFLISALLNGPWRDPVTNWPQSPTIAASAQLPRILARSRLHLGFLLAVLVLVLFWWVLSRTRLGLEMRAVRLGAPAARFLGIRVPRVTFTVALISGAIAGLAGASEVAGIHYHLIEALSPGYGYSGIIVAMLGGLHPLGVAVAAVFFGTLGTGAQTLSRALGVPAYLGDVVQATLLLVMLAMLILRFYRVRWRS